MRLGNILIFYLGLGKWLFVSLRENLKNSPNDERQISLRELPAGVYTIQLQTSEGAVVKQIIRQ